MSDFPTVVPALAQALQTRGYTELTPVQEAVIDPVHESADLLVSAQTGSGKTVAFGMALAKTLLNDEDRFDRALAPTALVIAPTRELAMQVKRELEWLYAHTGAKFASCVGGMDMREERRSLTQGADIVIGTPGRLRDHIQRGSLDMGAMRAVVLDEADEMLDLGFSEDLEFILQGSPENRRTLMFSATVPRSIATLARKYQTDPVRLNTAAQEKQHVDISYRALSCSPRDQENAIINVLRFYEAKNALVFCATRATVNHLTSRFNNRGFSVVALSGELSQNERTHALQAMRDGRARVCVATDVAARGIDLPDLGLVIHADIPKNREILLHRSGRTGRAGRKGVSALIVPFSATKKTERLLLGAGITADWATPPSVEEVTAKDEIRILEDPALSTPMTETETGFSQKLLALHSPEQIAAAFLRVSQKGRSAPEELRPATANDLSAHRDDFKNGVWFSFPVGRTQNTEPKSLLPQLCKICDLTKTDIGAIRIQQDETFVELNPAALERFIKAQKSATLPAALTAIRLEKAPAGLDKPKPRFKGYKKPYDKSKGEYKKDDSHGKTKPRFAKKLFDETRGCAVTEMKPKKPHKKKFARAAAKAAGVKIPGKPKRRGKS